MIFYIGTAIEDVEAKLLGLKNNVDAYNLNHKTRISFANGYSCSRESMIRDINALIVNADQRMYQNKKACKKNRFIKGGIIKANLLS